MRDDTVPAAAEAEFAGFVRAHTATLLRTAYLLTGSSAAAEELVQDTFARLYPQWHRVEAAELPLAYVRRSMTNGYVNTRRAAITRREFAVAQPPEASDVRDPYSQLADRDDIWRRLHTLPANQRAALVLRYFEDLSDDDAAAALGCRVGTVRSLVSRGLAALRGQLAPMGTS